MSHDFSVKWQKSNAFCFPWDDPVTKGHEKTSDTGTRHQEERESQREQIVWRLKRLLGDACDGAQITVETQPPSESICTEDFLGRFRDEMVDATLLEDKLQQQNNTEETDQERHEEKRQNLLSVGGRGATTSGKSSRAKEDLQYCQKHYGVETNLFLLRNERAWAEATSFFFPCSVPQGKGRNGKWKPAAEQALFRDQDFSRWLRDFTASACTVRPIHHCTLLVLVCVRVL